MSGRYSAYPAYETSVAQWQEEVPAGWTSLALGRMFRRVKRSGFSDEELLSVYRDYGVIPKASRDDNFNNASEDLSPYQLVRPCDLVMNKMKAWQGSIAMSEHRGIVSPAYFVYEPWRRDDDRMEQKYIHYLLRSPAYITQYLSRSKGIRVNQWDLDPGAFERIEVLLPSLEEQTQIAKFLDYETAKIDALIEKQQQLIVLLKEKRQAVISHAVTKGLNPDAPMRDSGVEWLGEVPAHWQVKQIKHLSPVRRGASPRPIDDQKYFDADGEYAWTRIADVTASRTYLESSSQRLSNLGSSLSVKLEPGSLFLSIAGTVGKPCITGIRACIHDGFVYFPELNIPNKFLFFIFAGGQAYKGLGKMGTQLNLNTDTVGGIKIGVPPYEEIEAIIVHLNQMIDRVDGLIHKQEEFGALLQERRTALISAAVTGKIDVRNWQAPEPSNDNTKDAAA